MSTSGSENEMSESSAESRDEPGGRKDLPAWPKLERHAVQMREVTLRELFDTDADRAGTFAVEDLGMYADCAKNRINAETLILLVELAEQCGLGERIAAMFGGRMSEEEIKAAYKAAAKEPWEVSWCRPRTRSFPVTSSVLRHPRSSTRA